MDATTTPMAANSDARSDPPALSRWSLVGWIAASLAGTAVLLAAILVLVDRPLWWRGLLGAGVVSVLSAAASLPPLLWSLRRGINQRVAGYFLAAGIRAAVSIGGVLVAVRIGQYPPAPTMLMMVAFYFAVLAVESTLVARALWDLKG